MADAFDHCEALVREADKDRFLATLFAPAKPRRALHALYAFNIEISRVREAAREPLPGEIRLQWWRDVFAGAARGEVRANPVAAALLDVIVRYRLPIKRLTDLIDAHGFDLYDDPMQTLAELEAYAASTSATVMELAALILAGRSDASAAMAARHAGIGHATATLLSAFGLHAARRQLYVPLDILARHGANVEDVFAGKATPELRAALAELRQHARAHLGSARGVMAQLPEAAAPAFLPAAVARPLLDRMERRRYDPLRRASFPTWRRQWILWRAARKGLANAL
jgi:phytoene synthase